MRLLNLMEEGSPGGFDKQGRTLVAINNHQKQAKELGTFRHSADTKSVLNGQRRSEYDVSNKVCVSDASQVCEAVRQLFSGSASSSQFQTIENGFEIFDALYDGRNSSYHRCETDYHNKQHVLDVTLATARLIWGYQQQSDGLSCLSDNDVTTGLLTALFHDVGYLRGKSETRVEHGAEFTKIHVSRSAEFLSDLLKTLGMGSHSATTAKGLVHFTGYEKAIEDIPISNSRLRSLGYLIGTADVIAQMADRTYLEKCQNFLYPEFQLGGMCVQKDAAGREQVIYASSWELMKKTPAFMSSVIQHRLSGTFDSSYRFAEACFQGANPYLLNINKNFSYLNEQLNSVSPIKQENKTPSILLRRKIKGAGLLENVGSL